LSHPVAIDGDWGDETSGAANRALEELGLDGQLEDRATWLEFLSLISARAFGTGIIPTTELSAPELLRSVYSIISMELAESPVRKKIETALTAFVSHRDLKNILNTEGGTPATPASPRSGPDAKKSRILKIAGDSECAGHNWKNRGVAPVGYIKGMALVYAKCYLESKSAAETAVTVMKQPLGSDTNDALAWYRSNLDDFGIDWENETERLRALFTLGIGLGMRESSGNTTEGRDTTVQNPTAGNAEAGLFQTSFDSFQISPLFAELQAEYKTGTNNCFLDVFLEGVTRKNTPIVGTGAGAEYQRFTKSCPAFATEYAMIMLRVSRKHFGPINRKEAEFTADCQDMLKAIEAELDGSV